MFFRSCALGKQGSTTISLLGAQSNAGLKKEWVSSHYGVCIISICFNHAHVSCRVVSPYTSGKNDQYSPLMITISLNFSTSRLFSRLYHISCKCNVELPFFPKSRCRFLHLDFGKNNIFCADILGAVLPKSSCRFLHPD